MITDLHLYLKVVATVAFGMGLDKRDVGAVRKKKNLNSNLCVPCIRVTFSSIDAFMKQTMKLICQ
jgi:hypothetical protein